MYSCSSFEMRFCYVNCFMRVRVCVANISQFSYGHILNFLIVIDITDLTNLRISEMKAILTPVKIHCLEIVYKEMRAELVKPSLRIVKHHAMKTHGGVSV
jgi:hypothetical protein